MFNFRVPIAAAVLIAAAPAAAQVGQWRDAQRVEIGVSNFAFSPRVIRLRAGVPVILVLNNRNKGGHSFKAKGFFANSLVRLADRSAIDGGKVEIPSRASREIGVVPKAGRYPLMCTHLFHDVFGMTGEIIVE